MAIDRVGGADGYGRPEKLGSSTTNTDRGEQARRTEGDRIELSSDPRLVGSLADRARELPEIRHDRVEQLRARLAEGTYEVDSRQVARALLEFEDDLAG